MKEMTLTSPELREGGYFLTKNTGRGEDVSPELCISNIPDGTVSLAITLDDAGHPLVKNFSHWLIMNITPTSDIPAAIPAGERVEALGGAIQGMAYGRHCYRGPKPPFRWLHDYVFTVFALDVCLSLGADAKKEDFLAAAQGHILSRATLIGKFQTGHKDETI